MHDFVSRLRQDLGERIKELDALHHTARVLQDESRPLAEIFEELIAFLPDAWQYPEITDARISYGKIDVRTPNFRATPWMQLATFTTRNGESGAIEICYRDERPTATQGPFLAEEAELINSLAEILRMYLEHRWSLELIKRSHDDLERQVQARTAELRTMNTALEDQVAEYRRAQAEIEAYQKQLRKLAAELSLTEARERRVIAADLHDHIGQTLAILKMRVAGLAGEPDAGARKRLTAEVLELLNQTIQYTRSLTFEISPPILHELGLTASLEWLGEQFTSKHDLPVSVDTPEDIGRLRDEIEVVIFKSVQELLTNTLKHAEASAVTVRLNRRSDKLQVAVMDDGRGFDTTRLLSAQTNGGFGLFSIRERLMHLGGGMEVHSSRDGTQVRLTVPIS